MAKAGITKRDILRLAGVATAAAALPAALRAEGLAEGSKAAPANLPFALKTPMHVDQVSLRVMNLPLMAQYYKALLAFNEIESTESHMILGAGGVPLLTLRKVDGIVREDPASAGLYHVAYLMPSREDLARWLVHAAMIQAPIDGFADHNVSEAIYLTDPEGNGIEVYSDRSPETWIWTDGAVTMGTEAIDLDGLVALADRSRDTYSLPAALRIGHIHLRVGEVAAAEAFYGDVVGLKSTRKGRKDAAFYSSGGYHHHVAMNVWNSKGAGQRAAATTGLEWFSMTLDGASMGEARSRVPMAAVTEIDGGFSLKDPWGTEIRMIG
jgi:catechol 2,3-dioxygenase